MTTVPVDLDSSSSPLPGPSTLDESSRTAGDAESPLPELVQQTSEETGNSFLSFMKNSWESCKEWGEVELQGAERSKGGG